MSAVDWLLLIFVGVPFVAWCGLAAYMGGDQVARLIADIKRLEAETEDFRGRKRD